MSIVALVVMTCCRLYPLGCASTAGAVSQGPIRAIFYPLEGVPTRLAPVRCVVVVASNLVCSPTKVFVYCAGPRLTICSNRHKTTFVIDGGTEWEKVGELDFAVTCPVGCIGNQYRTKNQLQRCLGEVARIRFLGGALSADQIVAMHTRDSQVVIDSIAAGSSGRRAIAVIRWVTMSNGIVWCCRYGQPSPVRARCRGWCDRPCITLIPTADGDPHWQSASRAWS